MLSSFWPSKNRRRYGAYVRFGAKKKDWPWIDVKTSLNALACAGLLLSLKARIYVCLLFLILESHGLSNVLDLIRATMGSGVQPSEQLRLDGIFRGKEQRGHLNASAGSARSQCAACLMRATSWGTYAEFLALMAALALLGFQTETASGAAVCLMAQRISKKRASSPKRICGAKNADQVISFLAASAQSSMIVLKLTFSLPAHPA